MAPAVLVYFELENRIWRRRVLHAKALRKKNDKKCPNGVQKSSGTWLRRVAGTDCVITVDSASDGTVAAWRLGGEAATDEDEPSVVRYVVVSECVELTPAVCRLPRCGVTVQQQQTSGPT